MNNNIGYILCESTTTAEDVTVVGENNNRVKIEAIAQTANETNRNRRIYLAKDLASEIESPRTKELIRTKTFFGEAGHPLSKDISRQSVIDLSNIAHSISKIWMEGDNVKIVTEGTPNELGKMFNDLILTGTKPAFSLRALGSIQNTAKGAVVKNLKLITYDFVVYPSHPKAYMNKIVKESAYDQFSVTNPYEVPVKKGSRLILDEHSNGIIAPITNSSVIDYIKNESANLKNIINTFDTLYENISVVGNHVQLITNEGDTLMIKLESYIKNEIFDYCNKFR